MKRRCRHASAVSVSLPQQMHEVLRRAADDDNRSVSSLVTALVHNYLKSEGYIADDPRSGDVRPLARQLRLDMREC